MFLHNMHVFYLLIIKKVITLNV